MRNRRRGRSAHELRARDGCNTPLWCLRRRRAAFGSHAARDVLRRAGHGQTRVPGPCDDVMTSPTEPKTDHVFPILTAAQIARLEAHGRLRDIAPGDVLLHAGDPNAGFFVVKSGACEAVSTMRGFEERIAEH